MFIPSDLIDFSFNLNLNMFLDTPDNSLGVKQTVGFDKFYFLTVVILHIPSN